MDTSPLVLSFEVAFTATLLAGVVGLAIAALLANVRFLGRDVIDALLTVPMVLPPTVLGYYMLVLLGRHSFCGHLFELLTGSPVVFTRTGAVVAASLGALPFVVKFGRASLESVDPVLLDAARTLRASPLRVLFTVQLPVAAQGILAALVLAFARGLGDFGVTLMIAGDIPGETQTASLAIYDAVEGHRNADASTMVLVLTCVTVSLVYGVSKLPRPVGGAR